MKKKNKRIGLGGFEDLFDMFGLGFDNFFPGETERMDDPAKMFDGIKHDKTEDSGEDEDSTWNTQSWTSEDGNMHFKRTVVTSKGYGGPRSRSAKADPQRNVKALEAGMKKAIDEERFEDAAKFRDQIEDTTRNNTTSFKKCKVL